MSLKDDFSVWLINEGIKSKDNYLWPLNQTYVGNIISTSPLDIKYEQIYEYLLAEGNYDWIDRILAEFPNKYQLNKDHSSHFNALKDFLTGEARHIIYSKPNITVTPVFSKNKDPRLYVKYPSFDGMISLLSKLEVKDILELTFKNSIFFDNNIAKKRFGNLEEECKNGGTVFARGNKKECPQYNLTDSDIVKDSDNNTAPRDLIKKIFGYTLSGENKNFYGYTISHLWGNANNPLFFTNLVNLALIPDWINHLLDKYSSEEKENAVSRSQKKALEIVNTIRKVAYTHYGILGLLQNPTIPTKLTSKDFPIQDKYVKPGDYTINVMNPKNTNGLFDTLHGVIEHIIIPI